MQWSKAQVERYVAGQASDFDSYSSGTTDTDFDWFACDRLNRLAVFSNGTQLLVPTSVFADRHAYLVIAELVLTLPIVGHSQPPVRGHRLDYGERGLFYYDVPRPAPNQVLYELDFAPTVPLSIHELPSSAIQYLEGLRCPGEFGAETLLSLDSWGLPAQ